MLSLCSRVRGLECSTQKTLGELQFEAVQVLGVTSLIQVVFLVAV